MKKVFEKIISLGLTLLLVFSLTACENKKQEIKENKNALYEQMKEIKKYIYVDSSQAHKNKDNLEEALNKAHSVIYGEVISRGESEVFEYYYGSDKLSIRTCCVTDVKIKVLDCIKGKAESEIIYKEGAGTSDGVRYFTNEMESPVKGEKVILFLSESGSLVGDSTKGFHIEDANGMFTVDSSFLDKETYEARKSASTKIKADDYIKYLKETLKNITPIEEAEKESGVILFDGEKLPDIYHIGSIEMMAEDIIYGKVISKSEPKFYNIGGYNPNIRVYTPYCFTEVEVEVISRAKGEESKKTVIYREPGGIYNGTEYKTVNFPETKTGDKVILLLTKNGCVPFGENEGIFIADENGNVKVKDFKNGGGMEGTVKAEEYINFLKTETEEYEKVKEEELEELLKSSPSGKIEIYSSALFNADYDYYDMIEETDLIVYGTVRFGSKDITVSNENYLQEFDSCFTQVFIDVEKCIYSEDGYEDIEEIMYLMRGGETDTVIYKSDFNPKVNEGEKVLVYLENRGAFCFCQDVLRTNEKGDLIVTRNLFPDRFSDAYSNTMTVEEYGKVMSEVMELIN